MPDRSGSGTWFAIGVALCLLVLPAWSVASDRTPPVASVTTCSPGTVVSDFDGNGCADLAIGVHGEDIGSGADAGAVNVLYGRPVNGLEATGNQFWNQNTTGVRDAAETRDWFGRSRESGDFNGDSVADLAIGAYGETPSGNPSLEHAGAVHVLYGATGSGLSVTGQQFVTEGAGTPERPEANDLFGRALAAGFFNGDAYEDLAIGADGETRGGHAGAGCVIVLYGTASGLDVGGGQLWAQGSAFGLRDRPEDGDGFGVALAAGDFDGDGLDDLAVGAVAEDRDASTIDSGAVSVLYGSASGLQGGDLGLDDQFITQDNDGAIEDGADTDDQFGRDLAVGNFNGDMSSTGHPIDDLVIGARSEDVVQLNDDAGAVTVMVGVEGQGLNQSSGGTFLTEATLAGGDGAEATDDFGRGLEAGRFDEDIYEDLAIGVDFEDADGNCPPDTGGLCLTGGVHVLSGSPGGVSIGSDRYFTQDDFPPEALEAYDEFGKDFEVGDFDGDGYEDLAISAWKERLEGDPSDVVEAGVVHVIYGSATGLDLGRIQLWTQNDTVDRSEDKDQFGWFG
jgi:hypothetical protein